MAPIMGEGISSTQDFGPSCGRGLERALPIPQGGKGGAVQDFLKVLVRSLSGRTPRHPVDLRS